MRLQEAAGHNLNHAEFLELILQDELLVRDERLIGRRVKAAAFRELKPLDRFDWSFNPSHQEETGLRPGHLPLHPRRRATCCSSARRARARASWSRPSATRRSSRASWCSTARSSTWCATSCTTKRWETTTSCWLATSSPTCLIVDDMGMKQLPRRSGEVLFEIIMRRYETRSTMMTSNRPLEDWGKLIGDVPSATAILDRFLHHAEIIQITGKSYRLRNQAEPPAPPDADSKPAKMHAGTEGKVRRSKSPQPDAPAEGPIAEACQS